VPWGVRIPVAGSALTDSHTVTAVCKTPGTSGCFVDWFGGNGFVAPNQVPTLWLGEPYLSNAVGITYAKLLPFIQGLQQVGQDFQADGLGVTMVDVFDDFNGKYESQCLVDQIHPALCGHQIIAAVFAGAMDWAFTKDQRIDFAAGNVLSYSSGSMAVPVSATSGLPVTLSVVSGPATSAGNHITPTGLGTVTLQANQAGDANYLPASATGSIEIIPAQVTVTATPSAMQVIAPGTISVAVQVLSSGGDPVTGNVSLLDGNTSIGNASLSATGAVTFSNLQLAVGNHVLSVTYAQQGNSASGSSALVTVVVAYPPMDMQMSESAPGSSVEAGQQVSLSLSLMPSFGFTPATTFTCTGLPAMASCQFSQSPMKLGAGGGIETVKIVTTGPHQDLPPVVCQSNPGPRDRLPIVVAGAWWGPILTGIFAYADRRRSRRRRSRDGWMKAVAASMLLAVSLVIGCVAPAAVKTNSTNPETPSVHSTPAGTSSVTITAVAVQGGTSITRAVTFQLKVME
jgi:Bacterial Ig-like domain (group 3)